MNRIYFIFAIFITVLYAESSNAQTVIYQDDFEGPVSGWSNNSTDFDPDVTRFLGRFDNSPNSTSRTFNIPAGTDRVEIEYDFYRFDSWDNTARWGFDRYEVDIDGTEIFSLPFSTIPQGDRAGTTGNVDWKHAALTGRVELAFGTGRYWFDQLFRFKIVVNNPGSTLSLTLRTDLNQGGNDESGGFDNMTVTAFTTLPNMTANKTVETVGGAYALPGNLVEYSINIQNVGGPVDADTLKLVDNIPDDVTLFTGDLDGLGNAVMFVDNSAPASGLSCCTPAQIEFSNSTSTPPVFGYVPASNFDPTVRYIRISPNGVLRDGQTDPVDISLKFRSLIQ